MDQPAVLFKLDPAERLPQDTYTASHGKVFRRTVLYIFSHLFVLNVFNVGHPAEA